MKRQRFGLVLAIALLILGSCVRAGESAHAIGDFVVENAGNLVDYSGGKLKVTMPSLPGVVLFLNDLAGDTVVIQENGRTFETPLSALGYNLALAFGGTSGDGDAAAYAVDQALFIADFTNKFTSLVAAAGATVLTGEQHYVEKAIINLDLSVRQLKTAIFSDWPSRFAEGFVYYAPLGGGKNYDLQRLHEQYRTHELRMTQLRKLKAEVDKLSNLQDDWMRLANQWETSKVLPGDMPTGAVTPPHILDLIFEYTAKGTILNYTGNTVVATYNHEGLRTSREGGSIDLNFNFDTKRFNGHAILEESKEGNTTWYGYKISFNGKFDNKGLKDGKVVLMDNLSLSTMEPWVPVTSNFAGSFMGPKAEGVAGSFDATHNDGSQWVGSYGAIQSALRGSNGAGK